MRSGRTAGAGLGEHQNNAGGDWGTCPKWRIVTYNRSAEHFAYSPDRAFVAVGPRTLPRFDGLTRKNL